MKISNAIALAFSATAIAADQFEGVFSENTPKTKVNVAHTIQARQNPSSVPLGANCFPASTRVISQPKVETVFISPSLTTITLPSTTATEPGHAAVSSIGNQTIIDLTCSEVYGPAPTVSSSASANPSANAARSGNNGGSIGALVRNMLF